MNLYFCKGMYIIDRYIGSLHIYIMTAHCYGRSKGTVTQRKKIFSLKTRNNLWRQWMLEMKKIGLDSAMQRVSPLQDGGGLWGFSLGLGRFLVHMEMFVGSLECQQGCWL